MSWQNIVIEGGGSKGIACLGALDYLYTQTPERITSVKRYAGSSAGSLIALFLVLGYTPREVLQIVMANTSRNMRSNWFWYPSNIMSCFGLNTRSRFIKYVKKYFKQKHFDPRVTFQQLYERTEKTLVITGTNISKRKVDYFSHITSPDMPVIDAIQASVNIPYYFTKFNYKGDYYIDGGVLMNFPLYYFDKYASTGTLCADSKQLPSVFPKEESIQCNKKCTIGIKTIDVDYNSDGKYIGGDAIKNLYDYTVSTIHTLFRGIERLYIKENYWERTIAIHLTMDINLTEFNPPLEIQEELWQLGIQAAEKYCIEHDV